MLVSIQRPLGYEPNTLPLRQSASSSAALPVPTQNTQQQNTTPLHSITRVRSARTDNLYLLQPLLCTDMPTSRLFGSIAVLPMLSSNNSSKLCITNATDRCECRLGSSNCALIVHNSRSRWFSYHETRFCGHVTTYLRASMVVAALSTRQRCE